MDDQVTEQHPVRQVIGTPMTRRTALKLAGGAAAGAAIGGRAWGKAKAQSSNVTIEIALLQGTSAPEHPAAKMIAAFNAKNLGVHLTGTEYGSDYEAVMQKAQANISAKIGPTIVVTGWKYAAFADASLNIVDLRSIDTARADEILARYRPWVADIVRLGDKVAGLPFAVSTPVLYFNRDYFAKAGLDATTPLRTWDDVIAAAVQLKASNEIDAAMTGSISEWYAQTFVQNNGGRILDDSGKAVFNSPEAIAGMNVWNQLRAGGHYVPMETSQMAAAFQAGNVAMYFTSIASLVNLKNGASFEVGTAEFPATGDKPKSMPSGGNFLGVYTQEPEQQQAALTYLDFASSTEGVTIWNESGYLVATNDQLPPIPGQEPAYTQMGPGLTNETIWPGPTGLEALSVFKEWVERMVNGAVSIEDGMMQGQEAVAALLP
jgi:multiple sugar transport system substrate-binding protein